MGAETADRRPKKHPGDHIKIAKEHFWRFNHDENKLLNCIVTGNEMLVHYAEPETKALSEQWKRAGSPIPKKCKLSAFAGKVMLVGFWDSPGTILV